jgi:hypothetical protein
MTDKMTLAASSASHKGFNLDVPKPSVSVSPKCPNATVDGQAPFLTDVALY